MELDHLPGGDLVARGLDDIDAGRESEESLLVRVGGPRLRGLGFAVPVEPEGTGWPEDRLYFLLRDRYGDAAHSQYNALIRRLVSFERAAECAR